VDWGKEGKGAEMARNMVAEIRRAIRRKFRVEDPDLVRGGEQFLSCDNSRSS